MRTVRNWFVVSLNLLAAIGSAPFLAKQLSLTLRPAAAKTVN
jgi:hypothetical protein